MPLPTADCTTNCCPSHATATNKTRLNICRPGSVKGLLPIRPDNLPKAVIEPESVIAPIKTPT